MNTGHSVDTGHSNATEPHNESECLSLVSDFLGKAVGISPLGMILTARFLWMLFISLRFPL